MGQDVRAVTERAGELAERAYAEAAPRVERAVDVTVETAGPVVSQAVQAVGEVLGTSAVRGSAAWDALRGGPVGPPVGVRRWPWAVGAALAGAAAGAAVAYLVTRIVGQDAPDAQEPEDLQAVVDRPTDLPPPAA